MPKINLEFKLPVSFLREGNKYIAYTPALDLSTSGKTYKEAKKRFEEMVQIFFEELIKAGTVDSVLTDLGWKRAQSGWNPPILISQESQLIKMAA
jgi:hypothetical protein